MKKMNRMARWRAARRVRRAERRAMVEGRAAMRAYLEIGPPSVFLPSQRRGEHDDLHRD